MWFSDFILLAITVPVDSSVRLLWVCHCLTLGHDVVSLVCRMLPDLPLAFLLTSRSLFVQPRLPSEFLACSSLLLCSHSFSPILSSLAAQVNFDLSSLSGSPEATFLAISSDILLPNLSKAWFYCYCDMCVCLILSPLEYILQKIIIYSLPSIPISRLFLNWLFKNIILFVCVCVHIECVYHCFPFLSTLHHDNSQHNSYYRFCWIEWNIYTFPSLNLFTIS